MKILHTADWHLGKRLDHFSRLDEQREVLDEICGVAEREQADVVLVAGDLFDTFNPPVEAVELFYRTLKRLSDGGKRLVVAIAGNHDSPDRIEAPDPLARECGIILSGYPHTAVPLFSLDTGLNLLRSEPGFIELAIPGQTAPLRLLLTPYANEFRLRTFLGNEQPEAALRDLLTAHWKRLADTYCDEQGINLLLTHLFMVRQGDPLPDEPDDEKPVLQAGGAQVVYTSAIPPQVQYTALGHLHRYIEAVSAPAPVVYSSSILPYSFSEAGQEKYVVLIEAEPGRPVSWKRLALEGGHKLSRFRGTVEEAASWLEAHPGDLVELTLVSETFLHATDRRRLHQLHPYIISIIPEISGEDEHAGDQAVMNPSDDIRSLFMAYFKSRNNGQEPNEELLGLFNEIIAETP